MGGCGMGWGGGPGELWESLRVETPDQRLLRHNCHSRSENGKSVAAAIFKIQLYQFWKQRSLNAASRQWGEIVFCYFAPRPHTRLDSPCPKMKTFQFWYFTLQLHTPTHFVQNGNFSMQFAVAEIFLAIFDNRHVTQFSWVSVGRK